ncbi:MAG: 50S ribosomal protein L13 [Candidatus Woesearchaeota archaeon]|nr:50S ribosomal protein L13 [Candidatus Woesearchaeota archaeon]
MERLIDATNLILGRMATIVAKAALLGDTVTIVNCENAVISGDKHMIFANYKRLRDMGTHTTGPFLYRMPDRFVKRTIRGMLPHQHRGLAAFRRIKCYIGVPEELKNKKFESVEKAKAERLSILKRVKVKDICRFLGGKV